MNKTFRILSLETSCDETSVSLLEHASDYTVVLSNIISSQANLHAKWGGVVPDLAAREHTKNIVPVLEEALREANISSSDIDVIAVTQGPGLIPALLIGVAAAKTLAYAWNKPLLGIHHIEGHIYANFISQNTKIQTQPLFPLLALVVSGGHTQLMLMRDHFQYEILGETQDDAAGEAFDKVAKMLGLPYPGGPQVAKRADIFQSTTNKKQETKIQFPRPMIHSGDFNFSFSGLKTAVLYTIKQHSDQLQNETFINEICYQFQEAVIDVLVTKTKRALEQFQPKTFVIAGGVSANTLLRERLQGLIATNFPHTQFLTPELTYSLDNAAMIGAAAAYRWENMSDAQKQASQDNWKNLSPDANLKLSGLE
jgi:N6-L-threonylcarbamoyladenine synthase